MTTFTTEDRINASPPHIVDSGASVKIELTLHDYISLKTMDDFSCQTCKVLIQARKLSLLAKQVHDYDELKYEAIKLDHYIKELKHDHNEPRTL